ncbi:UNVERIFIED_CONTAM: hypothetical protein HDU68_009174, partial [Siphonaria sp. JEL0065]
IPIGPDALTPETPLLATASSSLIAQSLPAPSCNPPLPIPPSWPNRSSLPTTQPPKPDACANSSLNSAHPTVIHADNQGAIAISKNNECHQRSKHMAAPLRQVTNKLNFEWGALFATQIRE